MHRKVFQFVDYYKITQKQYCSPTYYLDVIILIMLSSGCDNLICA